MPKPTVRIERRAGSCHKFRACGKIVLFDREIPVNQGANGHVSSHLSLSCAWKYRLALEIRDRASPRL